MDVKGADIDQDLILKTAKQFHGGHCFLFVERDDNLLEDDPQQRYIEFHFTPIKYLGSINTVFV